MSSVDDLTNSLSRVLDNVVECDKPKPHESLPADIWLAIFQSIVQETVKGYKDRHRMPTKNTKVGSASVNGPWSSIALSHVCHSWHTLTTSYPPLWSNIIVKALVRSPHQMLELWLKRSGSTGLSVWLDASELLAHHHDVNEYQEELRTCLILLKKVSGRWTLISFRLKFNKDTWKICDDIFPPDCRLTMDLSRLKTMEVAAASEEEHTICRFIHRFYTPESPNLLNVAIGDRFSGSSYDLPRFVEICDLSSVVSLILGSQVFWQIHHFIHDLALMTQLETLEIYDSPTYFYGDDEQRNRTIMPNLRKLTVVGWLAWLDTRRLLDILSLPSLKEVTAAPKFEIDSLAGMLAQSGSHLNRLDLTLHPQYPDWSDLRPLLSSSAVEKLQEFILVSNCDLTVDIAAYLPFICIDAKAAPSIISDTFPFSLISLTIIGWQSVDGNIGQLAASLFKNGNLRYLYVEVHTDTLHLYEKDYAEIRRWQRLGFDVDLRERTLD